MNRLKLWEKILEIFVNIIVNINFKCLEFLIVVIINFL